LVLDAPLASGKTETGVYAAGGPDAAGTGLVQTGITFLPKAPAAIAHSNFHYLTSGTTTADCPAKGQAAPGHLCIYSSLQFNATFAFEINLTTNTGLAGTDENGVGLRWTATGTTANVGGVWAYTAP
jgi:hypothetical protein